MGMACYVWIGLKYYMSISSDWIRSPHRSCNWSDPFKSFHKNYKYVCNYCVSHESYLPHPSYPWFYQPWWRQETTNVLITTLYATSHYFLCNRFTCSPNSSSLHMQDMLEKKDCYIRGRIYSKATQAQKGVTKSLFFSGDNHQKLYLSGPASFCVEVFQ